MSFPRKLPHPVRYTLPPMGLPARNTPTKSMAESLNTRVTATPVKCLHVLEERDKGRNVRFLNMNTGMQMNLTEAVQAIKDGLLPGYYVRTMNGVETPISAPDNSEENNLG